ncbi:Gfo/Idh/MocA family oxidoreductase [Parvularcula sp. ZS-1/3]|uniref:Gfo/Idh/MocA family oxidoreductase n=1 Tax=Parvularcula mediterranea TaxID=2732508 RepID=A0A7Y3RNJ5_9PROT|nr:Gfo/Idh/MocA family oxidoreductase [Parvularcula mediterranea]NNU17353.1 Gfo/Idh/MocA family oxidoreductase [Parvularcula mediterranea]
MDSILKAGVAGAGVFGGYHANKYVEAEGAELTAIYDLDWERAEERAKGHGARGFDDFAAFLEEIDVLTIATPATTHAELASQAIAAGKHVLVEKPIAMTTPEADALIDQAAEKGVFIQVGHQERYVAAAFGLFDREVPQSVRSRRMNRYSPRAGDVSVVLDLMIHDLDLLAQLTGRAEAKVLSIEAKKEKGIHADYVDVTLDVGGVEAQLIASRLETDPTRDLKLVYPDGQIHLDFLDRSVANTTPEPVAADFNSADLPLALKDPLAFGTQSFLAAVRSGVSPVVPGQAGRRALAMALTIEEAIGG